MNKSFFIDVERKMEKTQQLLSLHILREKDFIENLSLFSEEFKIEIIKIIDDSQKRVYTSLLEQQIITGYESPQDRLAKHFTSCSVAVLPRITLEKKINEVYQTTTKEWEYNNEIKKIEIALNNLIDVITEEIAFKKLLLTFKSDSHKKQKTQISSQPNKNIYNRLFSGISIILLLFALNSMPYGYYTFLKIFLFITSIYYMYKIPEKEKSAFFFWWLIFAIIYNPFIDLELDRYEWKPVNFFTILFILLWLYKTKNIDTQK